jgi:hypothetical protein
MKNFKHNDRTYHIEHHMEDDSRTVICVDDDQPETLLTFALDLSITDAAGQRVGHLTPVKEQWFLERVDGTRIDLQVSVNDYHWMRILEAEVAACKVLL